tara:strand:- start:388 stop:594 length:207 start_codon:yes stop_codon:yes gene_type:complete
LKNQQKSEHIVSAKEHGDEYQPILHRDDPSMNNDDQKTIYILNQRNRSKTKQENDRVVLCGQNTVQST